MTDWLSPPDHEGIHERVHIHLHFQHVDSDPVIELRGEEATDARQNVGGDWTDELDVVVIWNGEGRPTIKPRAGNLHLVYLS